MKNTVTVAKAAQPCLAACALPPFEVASSAEALLVAAFRFFPFRGSSGPTACLPVQGCAGSLPPSAPTDSSGHTMEAKRPREMRQMTDDIQGESTRRVCKTNLGG